MHDHHDDHQHRDLETVDKPLDAANQSLADALRASFGILKFIMVILVGLFLISNVRSIGEHEEALTLRLGRLLPGVHKAGLAWAFPYPIDEVVLLPTKKSNDLLVKSHSFARLASEEGKPLAYISRSGSSGLNPSLDGALLTSDGGLIHVKWKITYKIDDVLSFVTNLAGKKVEAAEHLLRTLVENVGIHVASELTADEATRTRVEYVQQEMRTRINQQLQPISSGITVTSVEMFEPTPPLQVRDSFDRTQRSENAKQKRIREALKERNEMLNKAAGAKYAQLLKHIDELEDIERHDGSTEEVQGQLDRLLVQSTEGRAGQIIKNAGAYLSSVVGQMQSDVELYRTLLPEYQRNPDVLIGRLWEQTQEAILDQPGVQKIYRTPEMELRLIIGTDPNEERLQEQRRLEEKEREVDDLRERRLVPVGPEGG